MELELRFYSLDEMAAVLGRIRKPNDNFKRDAETFLKREGYTYEWLNRRGVQIISREVPPQIKLKKLLIERLGLDSQVDALDFARYIVALFLIDGFASMPYDTKERVLFEIVERTSPTQPCAAGLADSTKLKMHIAVKKAPSGRPSRMNTE